MFVSYGFIAFLLITFVLYYLIPKRFQWIVLLAASFLFYYSAGKYYPIYILITATTVYGAGILMARCDSGLERYAAAVKAGEIPKPSREEKKAVRKKNQNKKKGIMLLCLFLNLGILAVTKYTDFVLENVQNIAGGEYTPIDLIVPLGISFYTFQAVGYLLDVYWNKCLPQRNYFRFVLFVAFFPQLIQGPISRYGELSSSLYEVHDCDWKQVRFGLERILWGYFKKLVVADRIGIAMGALLEDPEYYTGGFVFVGMIFWAVQLYADFTGGIDITIGIAQVFGIQVEENFIRPFFSKNIAEYWRRWHITMGTWFRDYVFYPLSISKPMKNITSATKKKFGMGGAKRIAVYISTILVWLATGIWHGAAWHFVAWGLTNGIIILISQECTPLYEKFHQRFPGLAANRGYQGFQIIRTFLLMCCIRLFDTYGDMGLAVKQFIHMFTQFRWNQVSLQELTDLGLSIRDYFIVLAGVLLMFTVSMEGRRESVRETISRKPYVLRFVLFTGLFFVTLLFGIYGVGFDAKQFIYNQF